MANGRAGQQRGRVSGEPREGERRPGMRAVGAAISRIAGPLVARHGGGTLARLKAEWSAVAGADLAALTWPEALGRDGALKLRVEPAFALELQHRAPLLIERINLFFGRTAVARLALVQGKLPLAGAPPPPTPARLSAGEERELDARLADIADPELRTALGGLARLLIAKERGGS